MKLRERIHAGLVPPTSAICRIFVKGGPLGSRTWVAKRCKSCGCDTPATRGCCCALHLIALDHLRALPLLLSSCLWQKTATWNPPQQARTRRAHTHAGKHPPTHTHTLTHRHVLTYTHMRVHIRTHTHALTHSSAALEPPPAPRHQQDPLDPGRGAAADAVAQEVRAARALTGGMQAVQHMVGRSIPSLWAPSHRRGVDGTGRLQDGTAIELPGGAPKLRALPTLISQPTKHLHQK
jgi:hypothetical protein